MLSWTVNLRRPKTKVVFAVAVGLELYSFEEGTYDRNDGVRIDVYVYNAVALRWKQLSPGSPPKVPATKHGRATAVLIGSIVYLWGRLCDATLHAFDVDTHMWTKARVSGRAPGTPEAMWGHSACVLGKVMYVHGGKTKFDQVYNGVYKLDSTTMVWTLINTRGTQPPYSAHHSATIMGRKMFVFGGHMRYMDDQYYNDIRVFDTETSCWLSTPSAQLRPDGRHSHSAFTFNGELYIVGGCGVVNLDYLWKFNPETFAWKKIKPTGKGPSEGIRDMFCCRLGDRIVLFRGEHLFVLDMSLKSLKTLCKLVVIQYGLEQSGLPHNVRWELANLPQTNTGTTPLAHCCF